MKWKLADKIRKGKIRVLDKFPEQFTEEDKVVAFSLLPYITQSYNRIEGTKELRNLGFNEQSLITEIQGNLIVKKPGQCVKVLIIYYTDIETGLEGMVRLVEDK